MSDSHKAAGSFIKGATILAAAGILSRLLGLFFKVPLYHMYGSYGNGIFYNVTNIYNFLLMVSTVGIPVAISKMVSENLARKDYHAVKGTFRISMITLVTVGGAASLFLFFGAQWMIDVTGWPQDSYPSILAIAPAPLIISVCSAYRGYFQGFQIMNPTAVSQILEQIVRVGLGLLLCWYGMYVMGNLGMGVAGSVFGATAGGIAAMLLLFILYELFKQKRDSRMMLASPERQSSKQLFKRLIYIAIPVTLTSSIVSLFSVIDSGIYTWRLAAAGINAALGTSMIGDLGNAEILINIPLVISGNLAVAFMPSVSESFVLKDRKMLNQKINLAIRLIILVGLPCCVGLSVLSGGIFELLFPGSEWGPGYLRIYAYVTLFMMLSNTFQSMLQGIDRFRIPLYTLAMAAGIRFVVEYFLLAIPSVNLYGIIYAGMITFIFLTVSNFWFLRKYTHIHIDWKAVGAIILSSILMGICVYGVDRLMRLFLPGVVSLVIAILVGVVVYSAAVVLTHGMNEELLDALPGSAKLRPIYNKLSGFLVKDKYHE